MTGAALLAAAAALLGVVAGRELLRSQPPPLLVDWAARLRRLGARAERGGPLDLEVRLARAGLAGRVSPLGLLAFRVAAAAAGLLAAIAASPAAPGRTSWLLGLALPAAGFIAPDALIERAARLRRQQLVAALPDALDRLSVSAASGRGSIVGLAEIAADGSGPLASELAVAVAELSAGRPQDRALAALRERVGGPETAALVAAIERSRRYGSPLAEQLRRQASSLRLDQRRAIQERAARAAPKIQLVVALVLVPSVLLMIAAGLVANSEVLLAGY